MKRGITYTIEELAEEVGTAVRATAIMRNLACWIQREQKAGE
ncbi:hypothetical protein [Oceanobacillus luteolus]|nr:hypothetical protein [Oceanobacillus luteolus]